MNQNEDAAFDVLLGFCAQMRAAMPAKREQVLTYSSSHRPNAGMIVTTVPIGDDDHVIVTSGSMEPPIAEIRRLGQALLDYADEVAPEPEDEDLDEDLGDDRHWRSAY